MTTSKLIDPWRTMLCTRALNPLEDYVPVSEHAHADKAEVVPQG